MSVKGYTSQEKLDRLSSQYATVERVREKQYGLSTVAHMYVYAVGTDAVEADSTTSTIVATAHDAKAGDVIRFTSGDLSGQEVKVDSVSDDAIVLGEELAEAPAAADTFQILRHKYPLVAADGSISVTVDPTGLATEAKQDDQIDLLTDIETALDGVETLLTSIAGEDFATETTLAAAAASLSSIAAEDFATQTTLAAVLAKIIAAPATEAKQDTGITALQAIQAAVELLDNAVSGNELQVDIVSSALPSGAATEAKQDTGIGHLANIVTAVQVMDDWDSNDRAKVSPIAGQDGVEGGSGTVSALTQRVVLATDVALPTGSNTIGAVNVNQLTVVDQIDTTPLLAGSSINGSGGAFVAAVATLAATVKAIQCLDTTGKFIGIYVGAPASEVLQAIIPPGADGAILPLSIASGARVSLRSMETAGGTASDFFAINFLG